MLRGTPTSAGKYPLTISVSNGIAPPGVANYQFTVLSLLAFTGSASTWVIPWALAALLLGTVLAVSSRWRRRRAGIPRHLM
jgi:Flp pilus assembly protein TadB